MPKGGRRDELQVVLSDLSSKLSEGIELAPRAGYLSQRLGVSQVDEQLEDKSLPQLAAFADDSRTATRPRSSGQLLALLDEET